MTPTYAYPLFDSNGSIQSGFINIVLRGGEYASSACRPHREPVYLQGKPSFRIRVKVKEEKKT